MHTKNIYKKSNPFYPELEAGDHSINQEGQAELQIMRQSRSQSAGSSTKYTAKPWLPISEKGLILKGFKMPNKNLRHLLIAPLEHIPSLTFTNTVGMNLVYTLFFSQSNAASVREDIFSRDYVHQCRKMLFGVLKPSNTKPF